MEVSTLCHACHMAFRKSMDEFEGWIELMRVCILWIELNSMHSMWIRYWINSLFVPYLYTQHGPWCPMLMVDNNQTSHGVRGSPVREIFFWVTETRDPNILWYLVVTMLQCGQNNAHGLLWWDHVLVSTWSLVTYMWVWVHETPEYYLVYMIQETLWVYLTSCTDTWIVKVVTRTIHVCQDLIN